MGMSISAKLIYGLPYTDIPEDIRDEVDELLDNGDLDVASPWYDSPREHWFVGREFCVDGNDYIDLSSTDIHGDEYMKILGYNLHFRVCPDVT